MDELVVMLPPDLRTRLRVIAERTGRSVEQCLEHAVFEFVEHWEAHLRDIDLFEREGGDRPMIAAPTD